MSPESGQLSFGGELEADDVESGTIYVLRSLSDHPYVAQHRDLIHKIGVTGSKVETRIADAEHDATYLLAKVEVVATYRLAGVNPSRWCVRKPCCRPFRYWPCGRQLLSSPMR
jgi:hypothetical protein